MAAVYAPAIRSGYFPAAKSYVALVDVYEFAVSPRVLERKIRQGEENILGKSFATV